MDKIAFYRKILYPINIKGMAFSRLNINFLALNASCNFCVARLTNLGINSHLIARNIYTPILRSNFQTRGAGICRT